MNKTALRTSASRNTTALASGSSASILPASEASTSVVPSQMAPTQASRNRRATPTCGVSSLSRYPRPPRAAMQACASGTVAWQA
ncbi:cdc7fad4-84b8-459f-b046-449270c355a0 [Thermothielavioides terrestris]|uniref:Cdc7fad4-84b8-459f-b046-449270c355a0 n=1 Tax=Thermothielavioides terrestris TaxID=2587410 RepID=A0A3S4F0G3_9PEZI|nr:cdc7fad4-84b8-459f-b046-449270c355a0 [Thermothielavioides terrestris]